MDDESKTAVDELVVLSKFEGEPVPENEFERISIHNGVIVSHDVVESGEIVGPVEDSDILGQPIGRLMSEDEGR